MEAREIEKDRKREKKTRQDEIRENIYIIRYKILKLCYKVIIIS